jgi:hypothetical protein
MGKTKKPHDKARTPSTYDEIKLRAQETARELFEWAFEPDEEEARLQRFRAPRPLDIENPEGHESEVLRRWIDEYNEIKKTFYGAESDSESDSERDAEREEAFKKALHKKWGVFYRRGTWDGVDEFFPTELMEVFVFAFIEALQEKHVGTELGDPVQDTYINEFGRIVDNISRVRASTESVGYPTHTKIKLQSEESEDERAEDEAEDETVKDESEDETAEDEAAKPKMIEILGLQHPPEGGFYLKKGLGTHSYFDRTRKDKILDEIDTEREEEDRSIETVFVAGLLRGISYTLNAGMPDPQSRNIWPEADRVKQAIAGKRGAPELAEVKKLARQISAWREELKTIFKNLGGKQKTVGALTSQGKVITDSFSRTWSWNEEASEVSAERKRRSLDEETITSSSDKEAGRKTSLRNNPLKRSLEEEASDVSLKDTFKRIKKTDDLFSNSHLSEEASSEGAESELSMEELLLG